MNFTIDSSLFDEVRKNWETRKKFPQHIIESIAQTLSDWTNITKIPFGIRIQMTKNRNIIGLCYGAAVELKRRLWLSKIVICVEQPQTKRRKHKTVTKKIPILEIIKIDLFNSPPYYKPLLTKKEQMYIIKKIKPLKLS